MSAASAAIAREAARRRTFAIISHPDAGKTTLTEKLLLYGGALQTAGSVRRRGTDRHAASDWMAIERERGISVTTSVLHFDFRGIRVNLLDTPGHNDFSEDTYRTLAAADAAVMLIDAAKGVEPQTIKLFRVCRLRRLPIVTFVNKMDRFGREPLELLDEIESVLEMPATAANWPIGSGDRFRGVYDRWSGEVLEYGRVARGAKAAETTIARLDGAVASLDLPDELVRTLEHDVELLDAAGSGFDRRRFLDGELTPVFFGSALTNFGIERFLERFVDLCPPPPPYRTEEGWMPVETPSFSGFVFKIQANMDPLHRDRLAFVRVCSGRFERGMRVLHERTGRLLHTARAMRLQSRERDTVEEAYPGDILGLWDPGVLRIGDSVYESERVRFAGIPRFSPEIFSRVRLADPFRRKQLHRGLAELAEEGAVQLLVDRRRGEPDPVLGAVGALQLDVVRHRLRSEYGVDVAFERLPYEAARWLSDDAGLDAIENEGKVVYEDSRGRPLLLFKDEFDLRWWTGRHPKLRLTTTAEPLEPARAAG